MTLANRFAVSRPRNAARLRDVLPREFMQGEYHCTRAFKLRDALVLARYESRRRPWPGRRKHVNIWFVVEPRYAIGWNEGRSGWSFEVIRFREPLALVEEG